MRKADIVLIVLAVLAVWATLTGALAGDRWTDERTVHFATSEVPLGPIGPAAANGAGARLNWTVPDNTTSAQVFVLLTYEGQAVRGGVATVTLRITSPDGKEQQPITQAWTIPQGSTSGSLELNTTAVWREAPHTLRDTSSSSHGLQWHEPLEIHIVVEPPSDVPLASYAFAAGAHATATRYAAT